MQYTIRSVPSKLDAVLRRRAQKTGKSLNEVVIEALAKGAGVSPNATYNDLDWFVGGKSLANTFEIDMDWLDSLPLEIN
jgi:hypothetical protein